MNPNTTNPLMFIMEADPARYVKTPAAAVAALLKLLEGAAALLCCPRLIAFLRGLPEGRGGTPLELLRSLLPRELAELLPAGALPGGTVVTALTGLAAVCFLAELVCLVLEGVAAPYLRFALGGSKLFAFTRKAAFPASLGLALCVTGACAAQLLAGFRGGVGLGALTIPAALTAGCCLLLWLRVSCNRGASTVMSTVAFEIGQGFKETVPKELRLGRDAFLLCLAYLAGTAALCVFADWRMLSVSIPAALAVKYWAVYKSWRVFRRCHR